MKTPLLLVPLLCAFNLAAETLPFHAWQEKPAMGWNSWDCFATTVTEAQTRAHADIMAEKLKPFGYDIVTVDIQWYEPHATGFDYRKNAVLEIDEFGRLLPAENRFPSAAGGKGFRPLADYIHSKGLRFGLHIMRGVPRQAVAAKTPVKGTPYTAADIADTTSICSWNGDMYGVDLSKPGAQEYYDSVFALLASWEIDFIKVDDLSRPYHQAEIEAIRRAIDRTGRKIVFSTSPGDTPVASGAHVAAHANMWRISDDFWDNWPALHSQFRRLREWTPFRGPGRFPDADMLPLGTIALGKRTTNFTADEQRTLLSLWSIARSPLIIGADLTKLDDATLALLTNDEVIAVNQASAGNRELFERDGFVGWIADVPGSSDTYLALFNTRPLPGQIDVARAAFASAAVTRDTPALGTPVAVDLAGSRKLYLVVEDAHTGNGQLDVVWAQPVVETAAGPVDLTTLTWTSATSGPGTQAAVNKSATGKPLVVAGRPAESGIGVRQSSVIEFDLPPGATRFTAFAGIDDQNSPSRRRGHNAPGVRFLVFTRSPYATDAAARIPVKLSELGAAGQVRIRDLWRKTDLGLFEREFSAELPAHGAGLYRISPVR